VPSQPEIQSTKLPRITVSCLNDLPCSKRYHATRVTKTAWHEKRVWPITTPRGSAYHDALYALHVHRRGCELPLKDLPMFARQAVHRARYERDVDLVEEQANVEAMVELFLQFQDPEDVAAIVGLEEQAQFDLVWRGEALACMSATIDRLLVRPENPKHLVLQEFKTGSGSRRVFLQECFLQLWCSHIQWSEYKTLSLELLWLDSEEHQVYMDVITTDMVRSHQRYLIAAVEHAVRDEPVPEPGPVCTWCPIRSKCQSGAEVVLGEEEMVF